jgi:hypothetical protein
MDEALFHADHAANMIIDHQLHDRRRQTKVRTST